MSRYVIAHNIRRLRRAQHMTQGKLAEHLNITQQAILRYEQGLTNIPTSRLFQLAEHLGCTAQDFFTEIEPGELANAVS